MKFFPILLVLGGWALAAYAAPAPALKDAYQQDFYLGAALNQLQFTEADPSEAAIVRAQFNSISPENVLKWEKLHPQPEEYDFTEADHYVDFGQRNHMFIIGHTLVWHSQTPAWVFEDSQGVPCSRAVLLKRMHDHISKVMGRYRGKVRGWDVVNEALDGQGNLNTNSPWRRIIGSDFVVQAFRFAHQADPQAELYYNDYCLENEEKLEGAVRLVRQVQAAGIPVAAVGIQEHVNLEWPSTEQLDHAIRRLAASGVKVNITELDVDVLPSAFKDNSADVGRHQDGAKELNPYANELPASVQQRLTARYAELFRVYHQDARFIRRVTLWGVTDGDSWLNDWPVVGRTSYPLLFDRQGQPKPAFEAVIRVAKEGNH